MGNTFDTFGSAETKEQAKKVMNAEFQAKFYVWNRTALENEGQNLLKYYTIMKILLLI